MDEYGLYLCIEEYLGLDDPSEIFDEDKDLLRPVDDVKERIVNIEGKIKEEKRKLENYQGRLNRYKRFQRSEEKIQNLEEKVINTKERIKTLKRKKQKFKKIYNLITNLNYLKNNKNKLIKQNYWEEILKTDRKFMKPLLVKHEKIFPKLIRKTKKSDKNLKEAIKQATETRIKNQSI